MSMEYNEGFQMKYWQNLISGKIFFWILELKDLFGFNSKYH